MARKSKLEPQEVVAKWEVFLYAPVNAEEHQIDNTADAIDDDLRRGLDVPRGWNVRVEETT